MGEAYASLDALRARLGIAPSDTSEDARLTAALDAAARGIEHTTGRTFTLAGEPSPRLFAAVAPRRVDIDDAATSDGLVVEVATRAGTYAPWAAADYELLPRGGGVEGVPGWPYTRIVAVGAGAFPAPRAAAWCGYPAAPVRVTAQWGWAAVPAPVAEACLIIAAEIVKLRDAPFGVAGYGEWGPVRVRQNPIAAAMLAPYVRRKILVA